MKHGCRRIELMVLLASVIYVAPAVAQSQGQKNSPAPANQSVPVTDAEVQYMEMLPHESHNHGHGAFSPAPCRNCGGNHMGHFARTRQRSKQMWNRLGVCCYGHHDEYGCDSLVGQLRFMFGSCRQFMGFRCTSRPPVIPTPEGYSLEWGYGRWR